MTFSLHSKLISSFLVFHIFPSQRQRQDFSGEGSSPSLASGSLFPLTLATKMSGNLLWSPFLLHEIQCLYHFCCSGIKKTSVSFVFQSLNPQPCWFFQIPYPFHFCLRVPFYRHNFTRPFILNCIYLKSIKWFFLFLWPRWSLQMEPIITSSCSGAGRESGSCTASSTASSLACYS